MTTPLRLLHLFTESGWGGTGRLVAVAIGAMDRQAFRHDVLFLDARGAVAPLYAPVAASVELLGQRSPPAKAARIVAVVRAVRPDAVFVYGFRANVFWRTLRTVHPACRVPAYVMALRSTRALESTARLPEWIDRSGTWMADLVCSNSQAGLDSLRARGYVLPRTAVARNGIDTERFHPLGQGPGSRPAGSPPATRADLRTALGLPVDRPLVLCVANLRPVKNHPLLFRAFAAARRAHPRALLALAGEDLLDGALQRLVRELGIEDAVTFLGNRTDTPELLRAADVLALTSDREGMPGAVLEAMASGLPVVATRVGGMPELVTHGVTGYLAAPLDVEGLARGLGMYLGDPEAAARAGAIARQRACEQFSLAAMGLQWEAAARQAVENRRRRRPPWARSDGATSTVGRS